MANNDRATNEIRRAMKPVVDRLFKASSRDSVTLPKPWTFDHEPTDQEAAYADGWNACLEQVRKCVPAATPCEHHFNVRTGGRGEPMTQECGKCGHREVIPASTDATPAPMPTGGNVTVQPDATSCMNCGFEKPFKIFYRDPETQRVCAGICFDCVNAATRGQAERPAPTWQPIDNYAKNSERWVLLAWPYWRSHAVVGRWSATVGKWWTDELPLDGDDDPGPTHYSELLPLPSAPRPPLGREGEK